MRVQLLGPIQAWVDGSPVDLGSPQQRCVFAVLAMTPRRAVPVDTLIDRVWGERVPRQVRPVLYTYVSRLRGLLPAAGATIRRRDGGYALEVEPEAVDLHRARRMADRARTLAAQGPGGAQPAELLAAACALWHGPPLAGLAGTWAERTRSSLEHERLTLLTERFEAALRMGTHEAIIGPLSEALAAHPLTEPLAGQLMRALHGSGRVAEALAVYRTFRERLVAELGDEPGPALQQLHERILRRDPGLVDAPARHTAPTPAAAPEWQPQCQLPPDSAHFVGRAAETTEILAALAGSDSAAEVPVIAINGPPGAGKTALAVRVAHRLRDRYPDGQWFVPLDGADPGQALAQLLDSVGLDGAAAPDRPVAAARMLRTRLADRRVLVVLDNASGAAQVRALLPGTPGSAVLVTSRRLLGGLATSATLRLGPLPPEESNELLERLVGRERAAREAAAVAEVSAACGGLPLALRIAAARLHGHPEWTVRRLAERLRDQRRRLDELTVEDLAVRAGVEVSYQELPSALQAAVRGAGALGNVDMAAWSLGILAGGLDGDQVVEQLLAANLLDPAATDAASEPRYRLHELVAAYAVERADQDRTSQLEAALSRHLAALLALSDHCNEQLYQDTSSLPPLRRPVAAVLPPAEVERLAADPWAWLMSERGQLVRAIEDACQRGWHEPAALLAERVLPHLCWQVGLARTERLYAMVRETARAAGDELLVWRTECRRCAFAAGRDRLAEAASGLQACTEAFTRLGALPEQAYSQAVGAICQLLRGRRPAARRLAEQAAAVADVSGDRRAEAFAAVASATVRAATGGYQEALALFERALALAATRGPGTAKAGVLLHLAAAAFEHGDLDRAESACRRAIGHMDEARAPRGVAWLLNRTARVATARGRPQEALALASEAAARFDRLGHRRGAATATLSMAEAELAAGHPGRAVPLLIEAAYELSELGLRSAQREALETLSAARAAAGSCDGDRAAPDGAGAAPAGGAAPATDPALCRAGGHP